MRLWPRSLFGRLLGIAALTTLAALVFAGFAIGHVLERFVTRGLDQQLDAQLAVLARAIGPDGRLDTARAISLPVFEESRSGWGWRVDGPAGQWAVGAHFDPDIAIDRHRPPRPDWRDDRAGEVRPFAGEGADAAGERLHFRQLSVPTPIGPVMLTAAGPRRVAVAPLREAMVPLLLSLGVLGGALACATLLQLRFGLRPLRRLQTDLAGVRAGRLRHIPDDQPAEIAPLAAEVNALIDQNAQALDHARRHVANLAHGLKTPLAALGIRLAEPGRDPDGTLGAMIGQIDRRVRHHLGRARAATPGGGARSAVPLAPAVADLIAALGRIHVDRHIVATATIDPDLTLAIDPQDLDEMIGNLLDNGWRHARGMIAVTAARADAMIAITIEDDGPGLRDDDIAAALLPGRRLDETGDGHGFGLPIARELAELNGGTLTLGPGPAGGLKVVLALRSGPAS